MSPDCRRFRDGQVTGYLEGALPAAEVDVVEFHLITCARCAGLLHGHRQLITLMRQLDRS